MKVIFFIVFISNNLIASSFDSILPGNLSHVEPAQMSFNPDRFIYSDDYKFLKSLSLNQKKVNECTPGGWRKSVEKLKDFSGKEVELVNKNCISKKEILISDNEINNKRENAQYIFNHITEGRLPQGVGPQDLIVGNKLPYSADWYPFYKGSTLEKKSGLLGGIFNKKKFQKNDVSEFGPTTQQLIQWNQSGKLSQQLEKYPMPIYIDILNGKTDPSKSDFYEFTRSEQKRLQQERINYKNEHKGLFAGTIVSSWAHDGMCESWSAAAINEPLPKKLLVRKKVNIGNFTETLSFSISPEIVAAANAVLYNRLMFDEMNSLDENKTVSQKERALKLLEEGYRDIGEACRLGTKDFSRYLNEIAFNSNRVKEINDEDGKNCFDLNFGLLVIVALNKIGVYGDLFFADFTSDAGIWHYPIAGLYLEEVGEAQVLDDDRAHGTYLQKKVVLHLIRSKTTPKVSKGEFAVESFSGRLDLSQSGKILGGRFTTNKVLDYLVDIRQPKTEGNPLHIIKKLESQKPLQDGYLEIQ